MNLWNSLLKLSQQAYQEEEGLNAAPVADDNRKFIVKGYEPGNY